MKYLTVGDVAEKLGLSKTVVYQLCSREHAAIRHIRLGGARATIRITQEDLDEFLADATVEPSKAPPKVEYAEPPLRFLRESSRP